jgi:hypothetical protein
METNATLLGSRLSLAPGSFRSLASSPQQVRILFIPIFIQEFDCFTVCSEGPVWKRLISRTLAMPERISLITVIFSDHTQIDMVGNLSGDDAQNFIDVIDEVSPYMISCPKDNLIEFGSNVLISSIRHPILSRRRSAGGVYALYTIFAATKPCFHGH